MPPITFCRSHSYGAGRRDASPSRIAVVCLNEDFDFQSGRAVGTGLVLMSVPGMYIRFWQTGEEVMVEVAIGSPVVELFTGLSQ
ncbi:MAG: hypothetical protein CVU28_02555 [Betaproteobacteria bacterium HGW-Betaproteobacteria-21]|nr:MAG: hypothetical protein CVU28_02555 [Betaproteobacteria bacterium HGW-Betaproteobacteria-21]